MRKRLIRKFTKAKEGSLGYTLTELLVVIGIIAILCAIAIPSIIAISRALRFKQRNDYAKSIFLAAQQNLTEMRSDGGLAPVQAAAAYAVGNGFPEEYKTEYSCTATGGDAFELILPPGSVDSAIRDDQIIIEYNPITGNIYSVFYCDEDDVDILSLYQAQGNSLPRDNEKARKDLMVGYYDGSGLNSSQIELEQTQAMVEFINDQEGIVRVLIPMPDSFFGSYGDFAEALEINLTLTGEQSTIAALTEVEEGTGSGSTTGESSTSAAPEVVSLQIKEAGDISNCTLAVDGKTVVVEYAIDSLADKRSFANYASGTQYVEAGNGVTSTAASLTTLMDEDEFAILPGENITIQADVTFASDSNIMVIIEPGILSGVNPMFEYLQPSGSGGYILAVSNGRNLQNLNAITPTIAEQVESVVFTSDIYWNDTVAYYNNDSRFGNGATYSNSKNEAPARSLPYFVPIHNEGLFGTARFIYPGGNEDGGLGSLLEQLLDALFGAFTNPRVPTLTDEMDVVTAAKHASIQGNGHKVLNLKIDSTRYEVPNAGKTGTTINPDTNKPVATDLTGKFYATGDNQLVDYSFTGLFGYVNTPISDLHVVNPIVKGHEFTKEATVVQNYIYIFGIPFPAGTTRVNLYNNPATGALVGAAGFNTLITDCSTYIDKDARGYQATMMGQNYYDSDGEQKWYGVSGQGAVGGLVGYAKSHRTVKGELTNNKNILAFSGCFAAVPVSGSMQNNTDKDFGYSNGIGAFIGNSQLTNFYNCYASGNVWAENARVTWLNGNKFPQAILDLFGIELQLLYNGRTSWGAGGFVGTSHGTRYTNCFATGNVTTSATDDNLGGGGFVGFMSIDETFGYGNGTSNNETVAQRTVFTECYSVGKAVTNDSTYENFSGANGRIAFDPEQFSANAVGDYYRLYAPYYAHNNKTEPGYESLYIYRDSYFLSQYHAAGENQQENSSSCAEPEPYSTFVNLPANHTKDSDWVKTQIQDIKDIVLQKPSILNGWRKKTYDTEYFTKYPDLNTIYQDLYDATFSPSEWINAKATTTHPYSTNTSGAVYPFSKLVNMDYYGDWPSKPSDIGMAYFEKYQDTEKKHFFFDKNHTEDDALTLRDGEDVVVVDDGYAIFSANNAELSVTVGGITDTLTATGATTDSRATYNVSNKEYHVFMLSDKLMAAMPEDGEFYVQVTAKHENGDTYTMYFNPNVALSHANPTDGKQEAVKPDAAPGTIYVRSARQFKAISTLENFWGEDFQYIQQLNIDASKYNWGSDTTGVTLSSSIGNATNAFGASYTAGFTAEGDVAKQYYIKGFTPVDTGLFGVIGATGNISELKVECETVTIGDTAKEGVAIVAGTNNGILDNVDLTVTGAATITAKTNAGLLVGGGSGSVNNCDVNAEAVTVSAVNAGGLMGALEATADAKKKADKNTLTLTGELKVTGTNVGGLIGKASYVTADTTTVSLNKLTANGAFAGGLAGLAEGCEFTSGTITLADAASNGNEKGYMAGVLGSGKDTALTAVNVTANAGISGNTAAGFLGTGTNTDASNCTVTVSGEIKGVAGAAGVAGKIGAQSVFEHVNLTAPAKITGNEAAGYALEIQNEARVGNSNVTLGNTNITGTTNAAGYACLLAGETDTGAVIGKGSITGARAAGFATDITGAAAGSYVSPAKNNEEYAGNANANLAVSGTTEAAGFALTTGENAVLSNSYTLCAISGGNTYGFVGTNGNEISRCVANVDITGGVAFVGSNKGLVTTCYGWYGDHNSNETTTKATVDGKCYSSYFVDMHPVDKEGEIVTLYNAKGEVMTMIPANLQGTDQLAGFTSRYEEYPYGKMIPKDYLYPMLRAHYGDWVTPPQYAYGVAYYELVETTATGAEGVSGGTTQVYKLHLVDLSDAEVTEEKQNISRTDTFDNSGKIVKSGYAAFSKAGTKILGANAGEKIEGLSYTVNVGTEDKPRNISYDFYKLKAKEGPDINAFTVSGIAMQEGEEVNSATVDLRFADAINVDSDTPYQVRTAEQLGKMKDVPAGIFKQTHSIAAADFVTIENFTGSLTAAYNSTITVTTGNQWMTKVSGTGTVDVDLTTVGAVTDPIFGEVTDTGVITLNTVKMDSIGTEGALVGKVTGGSVTIGKIESGAVAGKVFGDVSVSGVTVTNGIDIGAVNGQVFGTVEANTIVGGLKTDDVAGKIADAVNAELSLGNVDVGTVSGQAFGTVGEQGSVKATAISTNAIGGKLFDEVKGRVNVTNAITVVGDVAQLFGNVKDVTAKDITVSGNVVGKLFETVSGTVSTGNIQTGTAKQLFGDVASAEIAGIDTGAIDTQVFGNITGNVNIEGKIAVDALNGNLVQKVSSGTLTVTGNVETGVIADGKYVIAAVKGGQVSLKDIVPDATNGVSTLFGPISGGSVSGENINLGAAKINNNLFKGVTGGATVSGFQVTAGVMNGALVGGALEGTLSNVKLDIASVTGDPAGLMVGSVTSKSSIENCTVEADTVTSSAATFGILTGTNAGTLSGNIVKVGTNDAKGNFVAGAVNVSGTTVGGLVGKNTGAISGANSVIAAISYTGNGGVTIGGIVGEMADGISMSGGVASGSVSVNGTLTSNSNVVGGAIGWAGARTSYSGVTSTMTLSGWGKANFQNVNSVSGAVKAIISPNSNGPVGQFVGYASSESAFDTCSGNGGSDTYQFVGQVQHTYDETFAAGTYGPFDTAMEDKTYTAYTEKEFGDKKIQDSAEGKTIAQFKVSFTNCFYTNGGVSYQQEINDTGYYADGVEDRYMSYSSNLLPSVTFTPDDSKTVMSFGTDRENTVLTDMFYYRESDGNYYRVWAKYYYGWFFADFHSVDLYADFNLDGDVNDRDENFHPKDMGNTDKNKKVGRLYSASLNVDDGKYMIVGGDAKALSGNGSAVNWTSNFTTQDGANAELVSTIWTKTGNIWTQGSTALNLSGSVVGAQNAITIGIARDGASGLAVTLNGGKYLTYNSNSTFGVDNNQIGAISLYSVTETPVWEMTFSNDRFGQIITATPKNRGVEIILQEEEIPTETTTPAGETGGEIPGTEG